MISLVYSSLQAAGGSERGRKADEGAAFSLMASRGRLAEKWEFLGSKFSKK